MIFFCQKDDMWKALVLFCSLIPMCQTIINMPKYLDVLRFAGCAMMSLTGSPLCTRARSPYLCICIHRFLKSHIYIYGFPCKAAKHSPAYDAKANWWTILKHSHSTDVSTTLRSFSRLPFGWLGGVHVKQCDAFLEIAPSLQVEETRSFIWDEGFSTSLCDSRHLVRSSTARCLVVYRSSPGLRKGRDILKQRVDAAWRRKITLYTAGFPCQPYSCLHSHSEMLNDGNAQQLWRCLDNIATIKPKTAILENVLGFARVIDDVMKKIDGSAVLQRHLLKEEEVCGVQGFLHTAGLPAVNGSCVPGDPGCRLLPKFNLILLKSNC